MFEVPGFILEGRRYLDQLLQIDSTKTILEHRGIKLLRPDIYLTTMDGLVFAVEIFVTHETKQAKKAIINDLQLPAIEINLSDFYYKIKRGAELTSPLLNLTLTPSWQT